MGGWMEVKAGLRITYINQKIFTVFCLNLPNSISNIDCSHQIWHRAAVVNDFLVVHVVVSVRHHHAVTVVLAVGQQRPNFDRSITWSTNDDWSTTGYIDCRHFTAVAVSLGKKKVAGDRVPSEERLIASAGNDKSVFDDKSSDVICVTFQNAICRATDGTVIIARMRPRTESTK